MTDAEFRQARLKFLRQGDPPRELMVLLRHVVRRLIRFGGLPPMYSPTGRWDAEGEAEDEAFADWLTVRLVGTGQLAALLHQSGNVAAFSRAAEVYLRRHLINRLERNYASNLYGRLRELLREAEEFAVLIASRREQDAVWKLAEQGDIGPWQESEDRLLALAWGLGEFETIRYREDAKKLSPILERDELHRFVAGLLDVAGAGLTLTQLVRVLVRRFDLEAATVDALEGEAEDISTAQDVVDDVNAGQLALAVLAELTDRQANVLREWLHRLSVREVAEALQISSGTVSSEQSTISAILSRMSDPDGDSRARLLNALRDLLFVEDV
jgi:hypothetical protein